MADHAETPPPPYSAIKPSEDQTLDQDATPAMSTPGHLVNAGLGTNARVSSDGRVDIRIGSAPSTDDEPATASSARRRLAALLGPVLQWERDQSQKPPPPSAPAPAATGAQGTGAPMGMNIVIMIVGSRGDVQPFVALGQALRDCPEHHRVRLATHGVFKSLVEDAGLEFFSIGGDPAELMAFMVKNPGLMPSFDTMRSGEVGRRRRAVDTMMKGCWRACFEAGDGSGVAVGDGAVGEWMTAGAEGDAAQARPFVADCIIANPPSFAVHCAERLGVPLHVMFTYVV
jgi:Glycosyltransferase family 28 N-terminal domain